MEGASYEGFFLIADIKIDLPLPTERPAYFDPECNRGNTILMHCAPHGIWRVDYQLPPGETPEEALRPESLKRRIDVQLAMIGHARKGWEMDWCSVYSARTLTLPDYVHGRVIFTGDAAHLLPIFGVRGANTAFQDAQSLGWRLAFVAKGLAGPELLADRRPRTITPARCSTAWATTTRSSARARRSARRRRTFASAPTTSCSITSAAASICFTSPRRGRFPNRCSRWSPRPASAACRCA